MKNKLYLTILAITPLILVGAYLAFAAGQGTAQAAAAPQAESAPEVVVVDDHGALPPATSLEAEVEAPVAAVEVEASAQSPADVMVGSFLVAAPPKAEAALDAQAVSTEVALNDFVAQVSDGSAQRVAGVFVPGVLALPVNYQPANDPGYTTYDSNAVTKFDLAAKYGSLGFLAHNYLAGSSFFNLQVGQVVHVVYGDGSVESYRVSKVERYQALQPNSSQSDFIDLADGSKLSAAKLFYRIYDRDDVVVFQTCIAQDGVASWGRLFVTAVPI